MLYKFTDILNHALTILTKVLIYMRLLLIFTPKTERLS